MKSACAMRITVVLMLSTKRVGDFCVWVISALLCYHHFVNYILFGYS